MLVNVVFFAAAREITGCECLELEFESGAKVSDLKLKLLKRFPRLEPFLKNSAWAVDHTYSDLNQTMHDGAEIGIILPVSGG